MSFAAPPVNTSKVRIEDLPRIEELEAEDLKNYTKEQLAYYIEKHGESLFFFFFQDVGERANGLGRPP